MRDSSGGFILVSSLAALALLALLVTGAALLVRSAAADAGLARARLTHDALAHAGLEIAAYQLIVLKRLPDAVSGQRVRLDAGVATISVAAESGKIDLNGAGAPVLAALWRRSGAAGMTPDAFAARVIDWRDPDDARGSSGAERPDYLAAGRPDGPRDAPFETVDELRNVYGVGAEQAAALSPFLTVHNPEGRLSVLAAPRETLLMLTGVDAALADRILQLRRASGGAAAELILPLLSAAADAVQPGVGNAFEVQITVEGNSVGRDGIVTITRTTVGDRPYDVTDIRPSR